MVSYRRFACSLLSPRVYLVFPRVVEALLARVIDLRLAELLEHRIFRIVARLSWTATSLAEYMRSRTTMRVRT